MLHSRAGLLAVVMAVGLATTAVAPPAVAADDPRELQARRLYAKGEYDAALELYATLFAESGDPLFLRNIGRCNQKLERPDKAIGAFRDYLQRGRKLKTSERQEIESYIKEMEELKARQAREREKAATAAATRPGPVDEAAPPPAPGPQAAEPPSIAAPASTDATDVDPFASTSEAAKPAVSSPQGPSFLLIVAAGSGFGLATGTGELNPNHTLAAEGFAVAQLGHLAPQFGFFVTPKLILSAQLRLQYVSFVTGQNLTDVCGVGERYCEPSSLAVAAFGRVGWLTGDGPVHFLGALAVGGGSVRHAMEFPADRRCGRNGDLSCVDTLSGGPFLIGPGMAVIVDLGATVGLFAGVDTLVGMPRFTLNFDFNVGATFKL